MQGYIINFNKVKDEDLIVTILTKGSVQTLYRFYGARHSHINLGYKIDFESQSSIKSNIAQLRGVLHLASKWNLDRDRMFIWQSFIKLFFLHLKDVDDIDDFYFNLLEEANAIWHVQNPKRIAIEKYTKLLAYEGRLHDEFVCFNCEKQIEDKPSLARSFLPAHETCIWREPFERLEIKELFSKQSSIFIDDATVDRLWKIVLEGF
jgi:hypothetical protein